MRGVLGREIEISAAGHEDAGAARLRIIGVSRRQRSLLPGAQLQQQVVGVLLQVILSPVVQYVPDIGKTQFAVARVAEESLTVGPAGIDCGKCAKAADRRCAVVTVGKGRIRREGRRHTVEKNPVVWVTADGGTDGEHAANGVAAGPVPVQCLHSPHRPAHHQPGIGTPKARL